ncbi:MAG: PorP/SprF family type IX secretion system membrane protein [Bacteroidales bacterium]|nr:PorP/SprF family type IX secretion system membrane protein [Bacteroidales bacterium]
MKSYAGILFFIVFFLCFGAKAQDVHFSSLNFNPMFSNPAMTGFMNAKVRVSTIFRNQWETVSKGYNTLLASVEIQPYLSSSSRRGLGMGLSFVNDVAGELSYGERDFSLSLAYFFALNRKKTAFLSLGTSVGRKSWGYDLSSASFNRTRTYDDNITFDELHTLDLSAGINFQYNISERNQFNLGFAVFNINESKLAYFETADETSKINRRFSVNTSYLVPLNERFSLRPQLLCNQQFRYNELVIGTDFVFDLTEAIFTQSVFSVGLYERNLESIVIAPKYKYDNFLAGLSYDVNISGLSKVSHTYGAIEFWISYAFSPFGVTYKNNKIPCPIF